MRPRTDLKIIFTAHSQRAPSLEAAFAIETSQGVPLFASHLSDCVALEPRVGELEITVSLRQNCLRQGSYLISFGLYAPGCSETL